MSPCSSLTSSSPPRRRTTATRGEACLPPTPPRDPSVGLSQASNHENPKIVNIYHNQTIFVVTIVLQLNLSHYYLAQATERAQAWAGSNPHLISISISSLSYRLSTLLCLSLASLRSILLRFVSLPHDHLQLLFPWLLFNHNTNLLFRIIVTYTRATMNHVTLSLPFLMSRSRRRQELSHV